MTHARMKSALVPVFCLLCTGCGRAPSVDIIGSFFPVWMICLTLAIVLVFVVRYLLVHYQLESEVGPVALFYPSVVVLFTCLLWLIFFR
jgi:YtcA family